MPSIPRILLRSLVFGAALALPLMLAGHPAHTETAPAAGFRALFTASPDGDWRAPAFWITEGTRQDTLPARIGLRPGFGRWTGSVHTDRPRPAIALPDGRILLSGHRASTGSQLFVTDGTRDGTRMVRRIHPDHTVWPFGARPDHFHLLEDGRVLFSAQMANGRSLWVTDTTRDGTRRVHLDPIDPIGFAALGDGRHVFSGTDAEAGQELWVTDVTRRGTRRVADLRPGPEGSAPRQFVPLGVGQVLFAAAPPEGSLQETRLMVTDGTAQGTMALTTRAGDSVMNPHHITALGDGRAVLWARLRVNGGWVMLVTDGTVAGTRRLNPPVSDTLSPRVGPFVSLGDGRALHVVNRCENWCLWHYSDVYVTDGRPNRHRLLFRADMFYGVLGETQADLGAGRIVFGLGGAAFVTDGTLRRTRRLTRWPQQRYPAHITATGDGRALLALHNQTQGTEPWITDGTPNGTQRLRDIAPGPTGSEPMNFTAVALP